MKNPGDHSHGTFNTSIYHSEVLRRMAFEAGFLADTFDASGVADFVGKDGKTLNYEVSTIPTTSALTIAGTHAITDYTSTNVQMTLAARQQMYQLTDQEIENTAHGILTDSGMNSANAISEYVEGIIGTYLNLHITNVVGATGTALDGLDDLAPATAFLSANKVPRMGRFAALHTTPYSVLASQLLVNETAQAESMREGIIPKSSGLLFREAAYANFSLTNGVFGAGALTVKTTVAAGLSALIINGATATQTGSFIAGTVISIAHASDSVSRRYVIQADADTDGSTEAPITIYPALGAQATATDVITVLTGASGVSYKKNFVYHTSGFSIGSRQTAKPDGVTASGRTPYNWILTSKNVKADETAWGSNILGNSTLFNIVRTKPEYSVCLISS